MAEKLRLAFVGDIMCGDSFSLMGQGAATMIDRYGRDFLSADIVSVLKSHDFVMGNVECVLSDLGRKEYSLRRLHMRGRASTAQHLASWGITAANLANNHILEQGIEAAKDTAKNLKDSGIQVIGAGENCDFSKGFSFHKMTLRGREICLAGICLRDEKYAYDGGADVRGVIPLVTALKKENPDRIVILSIHWGNELIDYPSLRQRAMADQLEKAGVGLVIGHHPHVVQGIDQRERMFIAYSLGNFIFDGFSESTGWSIILSITLNETNKLSFEAIPIRRGEDFRPCLMRENERQKFHGEIIRRNQLCCRKIENADVFESEYHRQVDQLCRLSRKRLWKSLAVRFFKFHPVFWPQLLLRPVQRRLGIW